MAQRLDSEVRASMPAAPWHELEGPARVGQRSRHRRTDSERSLSRLFAGGGQSRD